MSHTNAPPPTRRSPSRLYRFAAREPEAQPFRILIAEDDRELRKLVASTVLEEGRKVTEVPDGARLLERLADDVLRGQARGSFDLVISDIRMPLRSGLQVLGGLRAAGWTTPMILMTSFGDVETHAAAERLGAVLLDKPFDLDYLRRLVFEHERWRPLAPEAHPQR
jgi:DNA-binding response OmpR family regulator